MAPFVTLEAHSFYNGYDLSTWIRENRLRVDVDLKEVMVGANAGWRSRLGGLKDGTIDLGGYANLDQAAAAAELFNNFSQIVAAFTFNFPAARDDDAWLMLGENGVFEQGAEIGEVVTYRSALSNSGGGAARGKILEAYLSNAGHTPQSLTASADSTPLAWQAIAANQRLKASIHVLRLDGTSPTLDVIVQSDTTGFASPTDRVTFTQKTAAGEAELLEVAGPITDDEWRISATLGGTSPEADFVVVIGV